MTVGEFVHAIAPDTPLLMLLGSAFLVAAWFVVRRLLRGISDVNLDGRAAEARLTGSIGRIGSRTGSLERRLQLAEFRRLQVESCMRRQGFELPPWPGDDEALYSDERADEDQADERDDPRTAFAPATPPVPPLPEFPRHRR